MSVHLEAWLNVQFCLGLNSCLLAFLICKQTVDKGDYLVTSTLRAAVVSGLSMHRCAGCHSCYKFICTLLPFSCLPLPVLAVIQPLLLWWPLRHVRKEYDIGVPFGAKHSLVFSLLFYKARPIGVWCLNDNLVLKKILLWLVLRVF